MPGNFFSEPNFFCSWLFFSSKKYFLRKYFFTKNQKNPPKKSRKIQKKLLPKMDFFFEKKIFFWKYFFGFFRDFFLKIFGYFREKIFSQKIFFARKKKLWTKKFGSEKKIPHFFSIFFADSEKSIPSFSATLELQRMPLELVTTPAPFFSPKLNKDATHLAYPTELERQKFIWMYHKKLSFLSAF